MPANLDLTPEDEAILDKIWERRSKKPTSPQPATQEANDEDEQTTTKKIQKPKE